jgi:hypothetical protein
MVAQLRCDVSPAQPGHVGVLACLSADTIIVVRWRIGLVEGIFSQRARVAS